MSVVEESVELCPRCQEEMEPIDYYGPCRGCCLEMRANATHRQRMFRMAKGLIAISPFRLTDG